MANKISYRLVADMTPTAAKAPYTGMAIPVGSLAYDNILSAMIKSGTRLTQATAKFFLDAFYEYAAEKIADSTVRISIGDVAVYPMIGGSFESEDAQFDPAKNELYIGATLSQDIQTALSGVTPDYAGEESATAVRLNSVMDIASQTFKTIDGVKDFRAAGQNLAVPDGEDESIALYSKDGSTKVADVIVSANDGGQQLNCHLSNAAAVPTGVYKLRIASHGLDPSAPLAVLTHTVTLVSAVVPPAVRTIKFYSYETGEELDHVDSQTDEIVIASEGIEFSQGDAFAAELTYDESEVVSQSVSVYKTDDNKAFIGNPFRDSEYDFVTGVFKLHSNSFLGTINFLPKE